VRRCWLTPAKSSPDTFLPVQSGLFNIVQQLILFPLPQKQKQLQPDGGAAVFVSFNFKVTS